MVILVVVIIAVIVIVVVVIVVVVIVIVIVIVVVVLEPAILLDPLCPDGIGMAREQLGRGEGDFESRIP